jgi:hypothetical protein
MREWVPGPIDLLFLKLGAVLPGQMPTHILGDVWRIYLISSLGAWGSVVSILMVELMVGSLYLLIMI